MGGDGEALKMVAQRVPGMLVVMVTAMGVAYVLSGPVQNLAHQVRANSFVSMMGMCGAEDPECRDRIMTVFEKWIEINVGSSDGPFVSSVLTALKS